MLTDFELGPQADFPHAQYKKNGDNIEKPTKTWLVYHGLNMYSASTALATNCLVPPEATVAGMETSEGRGVYTSRFF